MTKAYIAVEKLKVADLKEDEFPAGISRADLSLLKEIVPVRVRMLDNKQLPGMVLLVHNSIIKDIVNERD